MPSPAKKALSLALALGVVFHPLLAQADTAPKIVVPPLGQMPADQAARKALIEALDETRVVKPLPSSEVDEFLYGSVDTKEPDKDKKLGQEFLKQGIAAYEKLDIKGAIDLLRKAKKAYREDLRQELAFEGLRAAQVFLAMAFLAGDRRAEAKDEMREVVTLDPNREKRKLSAKTYSSDVRALYHEVREEILEGEQGEIEIISVPNRAIAYLDGKSLGATPVPPTAIPAGKHFILVETEGREPFFEERVIVQGPNRIDVELLPIVKRDRGNYFGTVADRSEIGHIRASYLDEVGVQLGAQMILFLAPEQGAVRAQLYDQRSQEVSLVERHATPDGLTQALIRHIDPEGYVIPAKVAAAQQAAQSPVDQLPPQYTPPASSTLSDQARRPLSTPNRPGEKRLWYENPWIWGAIGGGLLLVGGGLLLFTDIAKQDSPNSRLTFTVP